MSTLVNKSVSLADIRDEYDDLVLAMEKVDKDQATELVPIKADDVKPILRKIRTAAAKRNHGLAVLQRRDGDDGAVILVLALKEPTSRPRASKKASTV